MIPIRDHNPSGRIPWMTLALIALNVAVFLDLVAGRSEWQQMRLFLTWGLVPARITAGGEEVTLLTHMFLHGGWLHLAGNMLFLWIFGDNLEEAMGPLGFLLAYLGAGLAAAGAQILADPTARMPMVGASGAIAGVMGGYLLLFPRARIDVAVFFFVFFRIIAMPAWLVLCLWFAIQLLAGATPEAAGDGVAYMAHAGGFVAGLVLALPARLRRAHATAETEGPRQTRIPRAGRRRL